MGGLGFEGEENASARPSQVSRNQPREGDGGGAFQAEGAGPARPGAGSGGVQAGKRGARGEAGDIRGTCGPKLDLAFAC